MTITDAALEAAAELADRYISDRFLPDKAIDLIDEAGSRMRIKSMSTPPVYRDLEEEIEKTRREKETAIEAQEFEKAANLRDTERQLTTRKRQLEDEWAEGENGERPEVGEEENGDQGAEPGGVFEAVDLDRHPSPGLPLDGEGRVRLQDRHRVACSPGRDAHARQPPNVAQGRAAGHEDMLGGDRDAVRAARRLFDPTGHYTRPDVFRLAVDTRPRPPFTVDAT